jgi:hypothetical protein
MTVSRALFSSMARGFEIEIDTQAKMALPEFAAPAADSTFNFQLSTFNFQLSTFNFQLSTFNFSAIGCA